MTVNFYANGMVYPNFSFEFNGRSWSMTGNPGMTGDDGDYGSPLTLSGTPEDFMVLYFGNNWQ